MSYLLIAHELVCALLFISVFCRMSKTNSGTHAGVRASFWLLGTVAAIGVPWPLLGWPLEWFGVLLALAILQVQWVTSHFWSSGPPAQFHCKER
jgi:hypothetical protein